MKKVKGPENLQASMVGQIHQPGNHIEQLDTNANKPNGNEHEPATIKRVSNKRRDGGTDAPLVQAKPLPSSASSIGKWAGRKPVSIGVELVDGWQWFGAHHPSATARARQALHPLGSSLLQRSRGLPNVMSATFPQARRQGTEQLSQVLVRGDTREVVYA